MCKYKRFYTVKLRMAHYISYSLFDSSYYLDNRSNSRANTCINTRLLEGLYLLDGNQYRACSVFVVIHSNFADRMLRRRQFIQVSALSALDGTVLAYHGFNG